MSVDVKEGRRGFLRSTCRHCLGLGALGLGLGVRAEEATSAMPARFARPAVDSDEGGLWGLMDREETKLRRSPFVIKDTALSAYLADLVCRLGGEHCKDVRVHVVRTPLFNASMAPNGMLQVWTGLLLRVDNEAQLAAVLGHELGHYLERHTLARLRDLKGKAAAATVLSVFGLAGAVVSLGVVASAYGFSRDQEEQADRIGMRLIQAAGYDGREAAQVWDNLLAELKVRGGEDVGKRSVMFASHPPAGNRRDMLLELAGSGGGTVGQDAFEKVMGPLRFEWLEAEIRRGQFEESLELFDRKLKAKPDDPEWLFARGEVRRLRDRAEDLPLALADFEHAGAAERPPAGVFRSLGLLHKRREEAAPAAAAFEKYLALAPDAGDAGLIKTYLTEMKP